MRILHLYLHLSRSWGGGGVQMINLTKELTKLKTDVEFDFFCAKNGKLEEICKKEHFTYYSSLMRPKVNPFVIFKFITILKQKEYDIIHIHGSDSLTIFALTNLFYKTPPGVFHKKTSFRIRDKWFTKFKYNHKNIKKIICVSKAVENISKHIITDHNKLVTVYTGTRIKNDLNLSETLNIRQEFGINRNKILIGHIANHSHVKDIPTLLKVIKLIKHEKKDSRFHFIQIGAFSELTQDYKKLAAEFDIEDLLTFTNSIPNASTLLNQFDAFLLTSKSEGLPQVIYECLYKRVPVISTNAGGINEIVKHNESGLIVDVGDYNDLAEKLILLIENPELIKKFKQNGYNTIVPDLTISNMALKIFKIYRSVIQHEY